MWRCIYIISRFIFRYLKLPIRTKSKESLAEAVDLGRTGFPLLITGILYSYYNLADRSIIALRMSEKDVGIFALATFIMTGLTFTIHNFASLFYPRMAASFGSTNDPRALRHFFWKLIILNLSTCVPLCLIAYFLIEPFVITFVPKYTDGIKVAKLSLLSCIITATYYGHTGILAVLRKNNAFIICLLISLTLKWYIGTILIENEFGLASVIYSNYICSGLLAFFVLFYTHRLTARDRI
jgi:O-antigen/teichoic acid export membrane protein